MDVGRRHETLGQKQRTLFVSKWHEVRFVLLPSVLEQWPIIIKAFDIYEHLLRVGTVLNAFLPYFVQQYDDLICVLIYR